MVTFSIQYPTKKLKQVSLKNILSKEEEDSILFPSSSS